MDIKAYLKSGPLDVEYVSHTGPVNKVSKTSNKPYTAFIYNFRLRSTGETFEQMLFDSDHRRIGYVGPNALIRITANEKGYPAYTVLPTGEASMNVPQPKNTAQVATERNLTRDIQEQSLEQKARQKQISLAGVYQARLNSGMKTEGAREAAIADVAWLEKTALNLAMGEDKKFADDVPVVLHKPSVSIEEVDQVFGPSA